MRVKVRITASFLLSVAFAASIFVTGYGYHMLETRSDHSCLNDGFANGTDKCICKDQNYIEGDNCEIWKCINFGRGIAKADSAFNVLKGCDCPPGFRGLHCEPTACIPNSDGFIKAFNPVERIFSIIITYNEKFIEVINRGDTIIDSITTMLASPPFTTAIDRLHVHLIGSTIDYPLECKSSGTDSISTCFKEEMESYAENFGPFTDITLTTARLLEQIQAASTYSSVLLITNIGISDNDNTTQLNLIARSAVARQVELNVILVEPIDSQGQNIFYSPRYIPLIQLARKTLGTFIVPYEINGGPNVIPIKDIIPTFGKIIATKTVVDFGVWTSTGLASFNVLSANDQRDIYISVAANSPLSTNISASIRSSVGDLLYFNLLLDAGIWKLFKLPYNQTRNLYEIFYEISEPCTYHIWTVSQNDNTAPPHIFVGFSTDTVSDANYPIAVKGDGAVPLPNLVVAHVYNAGTDLQQNIFATMSLGNGNTSTDTNATGTPRNCLFDLQFTSITCANENDFGTLKLQINGPSYFEETVPIICGKPTDTQVAAVAPEVATLKLIKNTVEDTPVSEDVYTCKANRSIILDPTASKTFVLAFPNYDSLLSPLFSGLLDKKTFIKLLKDYYASYDTNYFNNFVLSPYTVNAAGTTAPNVKLTTNYPDFQQKIVEAYGNRTLTDPLPGTLDQASVIDLLVNFAQIEPFSEIFIITNKLYNNTGNKNLDIHKSLASKRIKLNFLLYDDGSFQGFNDITLVSDFYDLAARSGGNVILCDDKKPIEHFFDNYQGLQKSQMAISSYDNSKEFAGYVGVGEFTVVEGRNYYVAATISYASGDPNPPQLQLQGENSAPVVLNASVVIGRFYVLFFIPNTTLSDRYTVNVYSGGLAPLFLANVLEINPVNFYVIAFASDPTYDIQTAYPSYSGTGSRSYIVAHVPDHDYSEVTIRYPYNKEFYTGGADERTNCNYNLITSNYTWQCSTPNQLYYITLDTFNSTHTALFPCVTDDGSDTGDCQNGGKPDGNGVCVCPPGFMGPNCGDPVCYNGGTIQIDNTCRCSEYYTGPHCETATFSCQKDIPFPRFTSVFETFVLVVDLSLAPLSSVDVGAIPSVFQQYILVSAYQVNGQDGAQVEVYNNVQYFYNALSNLKWNTYPKDSRFAIKRALQAVKTERSLVVWLSSATVLCGVDNDNPQHDDELLNLIAKRKVELRAFTKSPQSSCHRLIASYGNGVPLTYRNLQNVFTYVNLIVPTTVSDTSAPINNMVVLDSYITDDCQMLTVNLAIEKDHALPQYSNLHVIVLNLQPNDSSQFTATTPSTPDLFEFSGITSFSLKPNQPGTFCGYIVEALHPSRVAYEVTPSDNFEAEGYGVFFLAETSNLNIYFENGIEDENDNFDNFPEVFTANVEYTNFTYEHADVIRRQCTYPWSVEILCNGFSGALKTKIIMKDSSGDMHQRLLTTYCIKKISCSSYGTKLLTDDKDDDSGASRKVWTCGCHPLWYGSDCSIPICLHGGTPNRESCNCPNDYYGSNCEYELLAPIAKTRLILIIYDVTGNEDQLESRKELVTEFLNMYSRNSTNYYAFSTNVEGGPQIPETNNASSILGAVNGAVISNKSINLGQAFDFFNGLTLQLGLVQVNGIFYITDSSIDPEQDLTSLFALQDKGFYLYSAYYYNYTDPSIPRLSDLSGLGGTTGAWNIYDILSDFARFLQGGDLTVVPPPPITTTAKPIPCVYYAIMDFAIFFDTAVSSFDYFGIFINMREFLVDLSNDLKFATIGEPDGSRASFGVVNQASGTYLCSSSAESLKDGANNAPFDLQIGTVNVNLNSTLLVISTFLGPDAADYRDVPKFAVIITDRPIIDNLDDTVAYAKSIKNTTKTNFIVVGIGAGDFQSSYGQFVEPGLLFTVPDNLPATKNTFQQKFYNAVCQISNNLGHGVTSYGCP